MTHLNWRLQLSTKYLIPKFKSKVEEPHMIAGMLYYILNRCHRQLFTFDTKLKPKKYKIKP
jgi:hypothetical protein